MKKFFYLVAIVATVALTACGGGKKEQKLSAEDEAALKALVSIFDAQSRYDAEIDDELTYKGTELVGRDIVMTVIIDESDLPEGLTIKKAFQLSGVNLDAAADEFAQQFFGHLSAEDKPFLEILRRCNSTLVYRMEGSRSHEKIDLRIPSEKLPK